MDWGRLFMAMQSCPLLKRVHLTWSDPDITFCDAWVGVASAPAA
ncbi:hypothetical protein TPA0598_08_00620 [Streptomyces lydicamycinicus]|uniref:Uncharacterized protein n=1 Tax=Streptomyces lydicamycinicus TaxID=1546107 RepID=A0A0P4RC36_9ACTN|nr:hypothetical protein TPA0598_08_00620 [Streptomyces lydicamycinicus]